MIAEEVAQNIPEEGIDISNLTMMFRDRIADKNEFLRWIFFHGRFDVTSKLLFPKKPTSTVHIELM